MAAGSWTLTSEGRTKLLDGTIIPGSSTFHMGLYLFTSNIGSGSTTIAGVTNEVANAFGYTTGGVAVTVSMSGTTTVTVTCGDAVWTASGGSIVARFGIIYVVGGHVLAYCLLDDTPADITTTAGNTLTIHESGSGLLQVA